MWRWTINTTNQVLPAEQQVSHSVKKNPDLQHSWVILIIAETSVPVKAGSQMRFFSEAESEVKHLMGVVYAPSSSYILEAWETWFTY